MQTLLERYRDGDCLNVWAELRELGVISADDPKREDVWPVVAETMRRTRANLEMLVERLSAEQYDFTDTTHPPIHVGSPLGTPNTQSVALRDWLDDLTGPLPMVLHCWMEFVGDVNLLGNHPDWPATEMYTDAMVVEFEYSECKDSLNSREYHKNELEEWHYAVTEDGADEVGPFQIDFAPDVYHKVNVSGGGPYGIIVPDGSIDGRVDLDGTQMFFTDYIRHCFKWGGFPGFASHEKGRDNGTIARLSADLLPV